MINIKEKIKLKDLCKDFPKNFVNLAEDIFCSPREDEPNQQYILESFNSLKNKEIFELKEM